MQRQPPASSKAEACVWRSQCGDQPSGRPGSLRRSRPSDPCKHVSGRSGAQPGLAVEVHEAEPLVADLEPGPPGPLSQVPQVVPVKAFELIRDEDAPPAPALDPGPVRMTPGDDLDERRASRARMPVGVGQAQYLTQAHACLRQRGEQQAIPQRPRPFAAGRIPRRARRQDRRDLRRGQQRTGLPAPAPAPASGCAGWYWTGRPGGPGTPGSGLRRGGPDHARASAGAIPCASWW